RRALRLDQLPCSMPVQGAMTVWFDLTTTRDWDRPPVGVVRVEQSTARWFLTERANDTRFCVYERGQNAFVEVPRDEAKRWLEGSKKPYSPSPPVPASPDLETRLNLRAKKALALAEARLPWVPHAQIKERLKRIKRGLDVGIRIGRHIRDELRAEAVT